MRLIRSAAPVRALVFLSLIVGVASVTAAVGAQDEDTPLPSRAFFPLALVDQAQPYHRPRPLPTDTRPPSATPTVTPTRTGTPTPTTAPTASPTVDPRRAPYPRDADTIVLQLGRTDTNQPDLAWEEMNGTPYLTLYGDGRLVAFRYLFGFDQTLYQTTLTDTQIQALLLPLHYDIDVFTLPERTEHPRSGKAIGHLYLRYGRGEDDAARVQVSGLPRWDDDPPPEVEASERVARLVAWMYGREALTTTLDERFEPDEYTVIAHEINGTGTHPAWPLELDVKEISDSAPLQPVTGYPHGPPGHERVDGELGSRVREVTIRDALANHPGANLAAEYSVRGTRNPVVVGARPEVPGGSRFLPDRVFDRWYREDGS